MEAIVFETEIISIIQRTGNVKSFRMKRPEEAQFTAGQYFLLTIDVNGEQKFKPFSFSSSPEEVGYIEFTKRITESEFSRALDGMAAGEKVHIKMPFGAFILENESQKTVFLSGGIGITPIRSICGCIADKQLSSDIVLLYGNDTEEDIVFKDDFDQMQEENSGIRVIYTLTAPDVCPEKGVCRKGYIDGCMIKEEIPDYSERTFYLCGPPGMVKCLQDILRDDLNLPEDRIIVERFAGY